jgi:DNA-directed RNA polymerase specialized sigma24 family protein
MTKVLSVPPTHSVTSAPDRPRRHRAKPSGDRDHPRPPLESILRDLAAPHREILVATYFRRQTTRQAAQQLGITHDDARRRVYHATRELTALIGATRHSRPDELPPTDPSRWRRGATTR